MRVASVLFSAGRGTRLRPLTNVVPKPAIPVLDIPLAGFALARLASVAPPVVVNLSHLAATAQARLTGFGVAHGSRGSFDFLIEAPKAYGAAGTLKAIIDDVGGEILVCNADLITDLDPFELVQAHRALGAEATIAVRPVDNGADLASVDDRVVRFFDRRTQPDERGMQYLGMAVLSRRSLGILPDHKPAGLTETLLVPLGKRGDLAIHVHDGYGLDVGTPSRYLRASLDVLDGKGPRAPVAAPGRVVDVAGGRAYIGPGATARPEAIGPGAILLQGATVAAGARVERGIVWPDELVPDGIVVRDAIWAFGESIPVEQDEGSRQ